MEFSLLILTTSPVAWLHARVHFMDGSTEPPRVEATVLGTQSHQVLVVDFRPGPPVLWTWTEPRDHSMMPGFDLFLRASISLNVEFRRNQESHVQKLKAQGSLCAKRSSTPSDSFSTEKKTECSTCEQFIANDTGPQHWGGNRDW